MMVISVFVFFAAALTAVLAAPAKTDDVNRVLYDQRQKGEWNVHADFKNFVILIIPTSSSSSSSSSTSGPSLTDFLFRAIPKRGSLKKILEKKDSIPGEETLHFIESKTAPYHVDISRSRTHLAKLHPEAPVVSAEEIVIAKSPAIALVKEEGHSRTARAFVLTVPEGEYSEHKKKDSKKKTNTQKSSLKLLGAENEQCGPGLYRDSEGICRVLKN